MLPGQPCYFQSHFHQRTLVWFLQAVLMFKDASHTATRPHFIYYHGFLTKDSINTLFYEFCQCCHACGQTSTLFSFICQVFPRLEWVDLHRVLVSALFSHLLYIFPLSGQTMDTYGDILYIIGWAASGETPRSYSFFIRANGTGYTVLRLTYVLL